MGLDRLKPRLVETREERGTWVGSAIRFSKPIKSLSKKVTWMSMSINYTLYHMLS